MKKQYSLPHLLTYLIVIIALVSLSVAFLHPQDPPPANDISLEVGSTTGITFLAFIIAGVITLPLLIKSTFKKSNKQ